MIFVLIYALLIKYRKGGHNHLKFVLLDVWKEALYTKNH